MRRRGRTTCRSGATRPTGSTTPARSTARRSASRCSTTRRTRRSNWHVRAYGLNAANPFGRKRSGFPSQKGNTELLKIEKGGELKLKYGVYAHTGDVKTGKVAEAFETFKK